MSRIKGEVFHSGKVTELCTRVATFTHYCFSVNEFLLQRHAERSTELTSKACFSISSMI